MAATDSCKKLTYKQRLQYEIIDIDTDLDRLAKTQPQSKLLVARIRDMLGRCVHLLDGVDTKEFCSGFDQGGLE